MGRNHRSGTPVATEEGQELYSQLLLRYVTDDDFDGFVAEQVTMGTVENSP